MADYIPFLSRQQQKRLNIGMR